MDETERCYQVPCPPFEDVRLEIDFTFVPTLEELRQAGGAWAGPDNRFYVIRNERVVLLPAAECR